MIISTSLDDEIEWVLKTELLELQLGFIIFNSDLAYTLDALWKARENYHNLAFRRAEMLARSWSSLNEFQLNLRVQEEYIWYLFRDQNAVNRRAANPNGDLEILSLKLKLADVRQKLRLVELFQAELQQLAMQYSWLMDAQEQLIQLLEHKFDLQKELVILQQRRTLLLWDRLDRRLWYSINLDERNFELWYEQLNLVDQLGDLERLIIERENRLRMPLEYTNIELRQDLILT